MLERKYYDEDQYDQIPQSLRNNISLCRKYESVDQIEKRPIILIEEDDQPIIKSEETKQATEQHITPDKEEPAKKSDEENQIVGPSLIDKPTMELFRVDMGYYPEYEYVKVFLPSDEQANFVVLQSSTDFMRVVPKYIIFAVPKKRKNTEYDYTDKMEVKRIIMKEDPYVKNVTDEYALLLSSTVQQPGERITYIEYPPHDPSTSNTSQSISS